MKQVSAKLKNRGATAAVLMLALGAAVYLNWSFSREVPVEPGRLGGYCRPMPWRHPPLYPKS